MPDTWLSYSLQDFIPFSADIYLRLFERINMALWPWQLPALIAGALLVYCCRYQKTGPGLIILALAWIGSGFVFHLQYFHELVWAADYFAYGFFLQGTLLGIAGIRALINPDVTQTVTHTSTRAGLLLLGLALLLFPLMGSIRHGTLAQGEVFALMPDPTCLATFGALLCFRRLHMGWWILPFCWSLITAALSYVLGLYSGFLVLSAALAVIVLAALYRFVPGES